MFIKKEHYLATMNFDSMIKQVSHLRLEPFVNIEQNRIIGYEVLSSLKSSISPEQWFPQRKASELIELVKYQLIKVAGLQLQEMCFFNLNILGIIALTQSDIKFISRFRNVAIEVNDVFDLKCFSAEEHDAFFANVNYLRDSGIQIWLDDFTLDDLIFLDFYREHIDGIKIDRREVRKPWLRKEISIIKNLINGVNILVEGVESEDDLVAVIKAGVRLTQGYLWNEDNLILQIGA